MRNGTIRPFILPAFLALVCLSLLAGTNNTVQAALPVFNLDDLEPITAQNASGLHYFDSLGFYGQAAEFDWRDNQSLAIGSTTGVRLYDINHLDAAPTFETEQFFPGRTLSPDGSMYYVSSQPVLTIFDARTNKAFQSFYTVKIGWTLSPQWDRLVFYNYDVGGSLRIADVRTGEELYSEHQPTSQAVFNSDGTILAVSDNNTSVRFIECPACAQMTLESTLKADSNRTMYARLMFSPDSKLLMLLATEMYNTEREKLMVVWDVASGKELLTYRITDFSVRTFAFTPDSRALVLVTEPKNMSEYHLSVWPLADSIGGESEPTGNFIIPHEKHEYANDVYLKMSPLSTRMALMDSATTTLPVWDISGTPDTWHEIIALPEYNGKLITEFSPDDSKFVYTGRGGTVRLWDISGTPDTWYEQGVIEGYRSTTSVGRITLTPDGKFLAMAVGTGCTVRLWDIAARALTDTVFDHCLPLTDNITWPGDVDAIEFNSDGSQMATLNEIGNNARIWDVATGAMLSEFSLPIIPDDSSRNRISFTADGQAFLIRMGDQTEIFDIATGKQTAIIPEAADTVELANGGTLVAVIDNEDLWNARLWDTVSGGQPRTYSYEDAMLHSLALSQDGTKLAIAGIYSDDPTLLSGSPIGSAGAVLEIRDTTGAGKPVIELKGHDFGVYSIVLSPDGTLLASTSSDRTLRIWETATGKEIALLRDSAVVGFSADNRILVTLTRDGLRIYGVPG